jgi:hypothetical protein
MMTVPRIRARPRPTLDATAAGWADSPWKTRQHLIWESMGCERWAQSIYGKYPLLVCIYYRLAGVCQTVAEPAIAPSRSRSSPDKCRSFRSCGLYEQMFGVEQQIPHKGQSD